MRFDDRDFVGRAALEQLAATGVERQLCLLQTTGFHPIAHGESVVFDSMAVATVTSGDPGHTLGRTYAFAYLPGSLAGAGTAVGIMVKDRDEPVAATVIGQAPYDPQRKRLTV